MGRANAVAPVCQARAAATGTVASGSPADSFLAGPAKQARRRQTPLRTQRPNREAPPDTWHSATSHHQEKHEMMKEGPYHAQNSYPAIGAPTTFAAGNRAER